MLRFGVCLFLFCGSGAIELQNIHRTKGHPTEVDKPVQISWGVNDTHIEIELSYPTQGWLAMGLSPDGGMDQADILFGYIDKNNEVVVQDRYLQANLAKMAVNLSMDAQQDWQKVSGSKNETYTVIRAVRKLKTCDPADRPFQIAVQRVIYSLHSEIPSSPSAKISYHRFRFSTSINFLAPTGKSDLPPLDPSEIIKELQFTIGNVSVTGDEDTVYMCTIQKIPQLDKKYQAIATHPMLDPQNIANVHHMLVYSCETLPEERLKEPTMRCGPADGNPIIMKYCPSLLGAWAMGAEDINRFPKDVGQPWETKMSGMYALVQVHYNNPERRSFVDNSGIKYLLSDKLRPFDMGTLMTGVLSLDFTLTLPPGQKVFNIQGQCSDQCTKTIPPEGITIFSSVIHMHTRGLSGVVRHFRGSKELPIIDLNAKYDFNYQTSRPVSPPRKFLPGDRIVLECNFTTENDIQPVFGGEASTEEMCLAFLNYYPKTALKTCGTRFRMGDYIAHMAHSSPNKPAFHPKLTPETAKVLLGGTGDLPEQRRMMVKYIQPQAQKYFANRVSSPEDAVPLHDFYTKGVNYLGVCIYQGNQTGVMNDKPPNIDRWVPTCLIHAKMCKRLKTFSMDR